MNNPEQIETIRSWLGSGSINIFGLPFAGKDSQGRKLADLLGGELIGGGELLRNSVLSKKAKDDLDSGSLTPTDEFMHIIIPYLSSQEFANKPLILSAVGRWHGEEDGVINALDASGHSLRAVIYLSITEDEARRRWTEHESHKDRGERRDDAADILENRFHEFHTKTKPVLDYYQERRLLIEVNGNGPRNDITNAIVETLANLALASQ